MKIYTRTGDDGTTGLVGNARISKTDLRINAIGDVDELNAAIGLCRSVGGTELDAELAQVQNLLFDLGAELASPEGNRYEVRTLSETHVKQLEASMDRQCAELPPLKHFILPGGTEMAARLHQARTICRRAERSVVTLSQKASIRDVTRTYLNRLSDWLFIAARTANSIKGVEDTTWTPEEN